MDESIHSEEVYRSIENYTSTCFTDLRGRERATGRLMRLAKLFPPEGLVLPLDPYSLLTRDDLDFVFEAYRQILGRMPDAGGLEYYLSRLSAKSITKVKIIRDMRLSKEGRGIGRSMPGLWLLVVRDVLARRFNINFGEYRVYETR